MTELYKGFVPAPEINDNVRVFLTQGDFARGQRALPVVSTWIGSFATGLSTATIDVLA